MTPRSRAPNVRTAKIIKVLIADDHAILRAGLTMLINAQEDMTVVAEASDGRQAIRRAQETRPHVALMDLAMPGTSGMVAIEEIARCCPENRVLVLSMHDDPAYLRSVLAAGASGYVLKRSVDTELLAAIRAVNRGGVFVDPSLAHVFVQDVLDRPAVHGRAQRSLNILSERERQVLCLIAQGYGSQQIAGQMTISVKTVETYRARIGEKLGLRARSDIVRFALQMGLLTTDAVAARPPRDTP